MKEMSDDELEQLTKKTERNELRARDAEARLRMIEAELALFNKSRELKRLREED